MTCGFSSTDDAHQLSDRLALMDNGQLSIDIIHKTWWVDAVGLAGTAQLLLADLRQIGLGSEVWIADLPGLAARGGHQVHVAAFGGVPGECAADAEGLVVGMRKDG